MFEAFKEAQKKCPEISRIAAQTRPGRGQDAAQVRPGHASARGQAAAQAVVQRAWRPKFGI